MAISKDASKTSAANADAYQRELAITDELLGLRAALAQEAVRNNPSRDLVDFLEARLDLLYKSRTWKAGRVVLFPARVISAVVRRIRS